MDNILYEILYIIDPTVDENEQKKIQEDINALILNEGGEILKESYWGKQTMAFPINKRSEGIYVNLEFKGNAQMPELIRQYDHTHTALLRHLTLRVPKAKLIQEQRDEARRRREKEAIEKARQQAIEAEAKAKAEMDALAESKESALGEAPVESAPASPPAPTETPVDAPAEKAASAPEQPVTETPAETASKEAAHDVAAAEEKPEA
jgi:small subunit ribosomal protein S6